MKSFLKAIAAGAKLLVAISYGLLHATHLTSLLQDGYVARALEEDARASEDAYTRAQDEADRETAQILEEDARALEAAYTRAQDQAARELTPLRILLCIVELVSRVAVLAALGWLTLRALTVGFSRPVS